MKESITMRLLFLPLFQHGLDVDSVNSENTLSFHLDLYARYLESLKVGGWEEHNHLIYHYSSIYVCFRCPIPWFVGGLFDQA